MTDELKNQIRNLCTDSYERGRMDGVDIIIEAVLTTGTNVTSTAEMIAILKEAKARFVPLPRVNTILENQ